jgi:hypothetical protein
VRARLPAAAAAMLAARRSGAAAARARASFAASAAASAAPADARPPPAAEEEAAFSGARAPFTGALRFVGGPGGPPPGAGPMPVFRALDAGGGEVPGAEVPPEHDLDAAKAVAVYRTMVALQAVDTIFYEAQRQVGELHK